MSYLLTITEAEQRHGDLIKGQKWRGVQSKYNFYCDKHGVYKQRFQAHNSGQRCPICGLAKNAKSRTLTIENVEKRCPDMIKGQSWGGYENKYKFYCKKHGTYLLRFSNYTSGARCHKCGRERLLAAVRTADGLSSAPEYRTIHGHFSLIFNPKSAQHKNYKNMPFFDGWNPKKGGSFLLGMKWVIENLGKRPEKASLHIVDHEKGFVPGNLEWAFRNKQNSQQMFKIIANLKHRIKELELRLEQKELA